MSSCLNTSVYSHMLFTRCLIEECEDISEDTKLWPTTFAIHEITIEYASPILLHSFRWVLTDSERVSGDPNGVWITKADEYILWKVIIAYI